MANCSKTQYVIGLDFGSLSCRGVIANVRDGGIVAEASAAYPHGCMDSNLPDGTPLGDGWCLQHPGDFVQSLKSVVSCLLSSSGLDPRRIVGIGVDFTASTVIPVDADFVPLCERDAFAGRPHAWAKMWKHHSAVGQAARLTQICRERAPEYLDWYGGTISPESLLPKVLQIFDEDPIIFDAAHAFIEAADYITSLLVGRPAFAAALASAKAFYSMDSGYPDADFFATYDPALWNLPQTKLIERYPDCAVCRPGERAGGLSTGMARMLGLPAGIAVAAGNMDGYAPVPGLGIARPGAMVMVVGTSTAIMTLSEEKRQVEGVTACLRDTFYPGLWGYASGQASVGDAFQWFAEECASEHSAAEARAAGKPLQQYLSERAALEEPGASGILALDWLNGNRSCLGNSRLSGMFLGITLGTRPEELYRALLEATAFGARRIVEAHEDAGLSADEIVVCGGIPAKNPLMMQIYADVLCKPLKVSRCAQVPALGTAVYAATAAGESTGYLSAAEAADAMGCRDHVIFVPDEANSVCYQELYREYCQLYDYFGKGGNGVMERLYERKHSARQRAIEKR